GMALAIVVTALGAQVTGYQVLVPAVVVGVLIGATLAARVAMTSMPQLVAILHSFVGAAAVLVGIASYLDPANDLTGVEHTIHEVEVCAGASIGAATCAGSVVAFGPLRGGSGSRPLLLPGRHFLNRAMLLGSIALGVQFVGQPHHGG